MSIWSSFRSLVRSFSPLEKFGRSHDAAEDMTRDEIVGGMRRVARSMVRGGYYSCQEIIETVRELADDENLPDFDAVQTVDAEIEQLKSEQINWPAYTDYDRLQEAMRALESSGIVTRQNFSCCMTCGHAEMGDEIAKFQSTGRRARGYAFFHQQATEAVVEGEEINFAYGVVKDPGSAVDIANEVANCMRAAGLEVNWNGKDTMCVMVAMDWKRRWVST